MADKACRHRSQAEVVAFLGNRASIDCNLDAVKAAVGETGLDDRMAVLFFVADVDIDFAGNAVGDHARRAERAVVEKHDNGFFLRIGASDDVLVRHAPQARQLPSLSCLRLGGDPRPGPPLINYQVAYDGGRFLAV